ncbi:unnamed protein product, partial [marine sediment metagenome]
MAVFFHFFISYPSTVEDYTAGNIKLSHCLHCQNEVIEPERGRLSYQQTEITILNCFHHWAGS